jgi:hypothetical protein
MSASVGSKLPRNCTAAIPSPHGQSGLKKGILINRILHFFEEKTMFALMNPAYHAIELGVNP